ncbi:hypothetical protein V8E55_001485 [Tylopilus felleus]
MIRSSEDPILTCANTTLVHHTPASVSHTHLSTIRKRKYKHHNARLPRHRSPCMPNLPSRSGVFALHPCRRKTSPHTNCTTFEYLLHKRRLTVVMVNVLQRWASQGQQSVGSRNHVSVRILDPHPIRSLTYADLRRSIEPQHISPAGGHSDDVDHVSWSPTHSELFCTSSQKDRRVVFWDVRQSHHVQQLELKVSLLFFRTGKTTHHPKISGRSRTKMGESPATHVGGCVVAALDPEERYLASGGILRKRCPMPSAFRLMANILAIASTGSYIDICATETMTSPHRVPALAPSLTVTWHLSTFSCTAGRRSREKAALLQSI